MNDRERLTEILDTAKIKQAFRSSTGVVTGLYHAKIVNSDYVKPLVELLIANGVTVQKHGRWIMRGGRRYCSECGQRACVTRDSEDFWYTVGTDYCPNCGAKMDGERKENE